MTAFATEARLDVIRYSQVWEDHRVLQRALAVGPGDDVLSIASAGDNVLALLLEEPRSITALDVSQAQLALLELKLVALERLSHAEFACLLGARDGERPYARVRDGLSVQARAFWDANRAELDRGVLRTGMLERYFEQFRARHIPREAERLLGLDDRERQTAIFDQTLGSPAFAAAVRATFTPAAMSGRARDASQFRYVDADDPAGFFLDRLRHVCTALPTRGNFYLEWFLTGHYRDLAEGPPWLRPQNYDRLRGLSDRVTLVEEELASYGGTFSAANLSDVFEYLPADATDELLEQLTAQLRPGGRIAFWNLLVPRGAAPRPELLEQDRVFFYSAFHLHQKP